MAAGDQGGHVKGAADAGPTAIDATAAPVGAAVVVEGGNAGEGGDAFSIEGAQLGQVGDQGPGGPGTDAEDAPEEVLLFPPGETLADALVQVPVEVLEGRLQVGDVGLQGRPEGGGLVQAIPFGHQHVHHLPPSGQEGLEFLSFGVGQGPDLGTDNSAK